MNAFDRQDRYIVIKKADVEAGIKSGRVTHNDKFQLNALIDLMVEVRADRGKAPLSAMVIESDWPEYEPKWAEIEARATGGAEPAKAPRYEFDAPALEIAQKIMECSVTAFQDDWPDERLTAAIQCLVVEAMKWAAPITPVTDDQLAKLRSLIGGATPGEWHQESERDCPWNIVDENGAQVALMQQRSPIRDNPKQTDRTGNAAFIAGFNPKVAAQLIERVASAESQLGSFKLACDEWLDKTDWVQTDKRFNVLLPWGKHRADVIREYIERLEAQVNGIPFMYGIADPDGTPHMDEFCVSTSLGDLADEVSRLNDDIPEGEQKYTVVKLVNAGEVQP